MLSEVEARISQPERCFNFALRASFSMPGSNGLIHSRWTRASASRLDVNDMQSIAPLPGMLAFSSRPA